MTRTHHVFLTRFNLPSPGVESLVRADSAWLRERIDLFEKYTVSSVLAQRRPNSSWLIYMDPDSPQWLRDRMGILEKSGAAVLVYRTSDAAEDVARDVDSILESTVDRVITSNLDNDDGLAKDFVDRLFEAAGSSDREAIYFARGIVKCGGDLYLHTDRRNAFAAVAEPRDCMMTCWVDWHNRLGRHMPVRVVDGAPAWLQVVHGRNVSNRVKGHLVGHEAYREVFGSIIEASHEPSLVRRMVSRLVAAPARSARDSARQALVRALMRIGGKDAVERWKLRLERCRRRTCR